MSNTHKNIGCQLHNISNILKRRMNYKLASVLHTTDNVTRMNGWILSYLASHSDGEVFQKDIEAAFSVRRSTVSKVIGLMEEKGLIERCPVPYDARLKRLILTPQGKMVQEAIAKEINETEALLRQDVTAEELEVFFRVIKKFENNIQ